LKNKIKHKEAKEEKRNVLRIQKGTPNDNDDNNDKEEKKKKNCEDNAQKESRENEIHCNCLFSSPDAIIIYF
jgi:hypothetical protein